MDDLQSQVPLEVTLDTCDLEPIRTPGSIQPFGALIAGPSDLSRITYCSANVSSALGIPADRLLGTPVADQLGIEVVHAARNLLSQSTARSQRERLGEFALHSGRFEIYAHLNPDKLAVIELEPVVEDPTPSHKAPIDQMRKYLAAASAKDSIKGLLDVSVAGLHALTGYDRVLAYRYAENGDGEVVAEMRNERADSFLGLRYPAWDVPEQARALQVKNPVRMLSDVNQAPVAILAYERDMPPLDIGLAHLRGISPIHVEYMQNMGVGASLTLGLVVDGRLWGMFACHHMGPKLVSSDLRIAVELFAQMTSLVIKQKIDIEVTARRHQASAAREKILAQTDATTDLLHAFPQLAPILCDVISCDGVAVLYEGKVLTDGSVPSMEVIHALENEIGDDGGSVAVFGSLGSEPGYEPASLGRTAGALLLQSSAAYPLSVMFFRDEIEQLVTWAGRPEKQTEVGPLGPRISPRGSFAAYLESVRGACEPWMDADRSAAEELQSVLTQIAAKGERVQLMRRRDLVSHQRQQDLMIAELNHRVKNILALIRSLSRQAKASSASLESYALALEQRIAALAAAHDIAVSNTLQGVSLRMMLETELSPFLSEGGAQVLISGPLVGLRPDVAPIVALVLHEIVSNAVKYGALSTPDGIITARWNVTDEGLSFHWREMEGPSVTPPERHGFGRTLIERAIPYELDGSSELRFDPDGVRFEFVLMKSCLAELKEDGDVRIVGTVARVERAADGKRVLLIEDNVVLAMDMVESLTRLGAASVETAPTLEKGIHLAERGGFDFAVLDMNLRGTVSFKLAELLQAAGTPFLFVTGYGSSIDMPPHLSQVAILTKPIDEGTLSRAIEALLPETDGA